MTNDIPCGRCGAIPARECPFSGLNESQALFFCDPCHEEWHEEIKMAVRVHPL